jgi:Tfp pilus assembly protein PilF
MARIHLGQAYYLMRMHTQAIKQLDEALVVDPSNLLAHYNRAIVLHRGLREFKRARDSLEIVLSAPETGSSLRKKALGAVRNLDRDAQGRDNLATIGSF